MTVVDFFVDGGEVVRRETRVSARGALERRDIVIGEGLPVDQYDFGGFDVI